MLQNMGVFQNNITKKLMNCKKQTAIEWLLQQFDGEKSPKQWEDVFKQAKTMEKEQIIDAVEYGNSYFPQVPVDISEYYYKNTYEK